MKPLELRSLVLAALLALPGLGLAQTATNNLTVTATVQAACSVDAGALAFGTYNPNAVLDQNTTFTVRCTQGASFWVGLGPGLNGAATRQMSDGTNFLGYELYRSALDRTSGTVWDNADPGVASHVTASTAGYAPYTVDLYGRIPAGQWVPAGSYTDTVVMTVNF
jgi:spore coat protein U-like protein